MSASRIEDARRALPVYPLREELVAAVQKHPVLVVVGETGRSLRQQALGSGKTTQIPQYVLEAFPEEWHIAVTQPRRIAATSVANRVAKEQRVELGGSRVGYTIRFDDRSTPRTRLRYMTDGVLLRETMSDPDLRRYQLVIVDEAHERSLDTDMLLGLLKRARRRRPELRVLVMSATLNVEKFSDFFDACPIFSIPGRVYPVEILHHRSARLKHLKSAHVQHVVDTALHVHHQEPAGDMLLFLTGKQEVEQACSELRAAAHKDVRKHREGNGDDQVSPMDMVVYPLYSTMDSYEQASIFERAPRDTRKVIVATNIAQTSVTIPGIRYVVDCGFVKQKVYDPRVGMDALLTVQISQAAALQRAGRAGRTLGGKCYRIYCKEDFEEMDRETVPEIQRSNLLGVTLHMKRVGIDDVLDFEFLDPPDTALMINAIKQLYLLDALTLDGQLTETGRDMAALPVSPYLSRALIAASREFNCSREMVMLAAMLSVEGVFMQPRDEAKREKAIEAHRAFYHASGDHCTLISVFLKWRAAGFSHSWCCDHYLRTQAMRSARGIYDQLRDNIQRLGTPNPSSDGAKKGDGSEDAGDGQLQASARIVVAMRSLQ
ncbi:P-loop containing nucleoside triphosphate hydrolase protein [Thamnocephalis sphaerospora]|uniref:RNA helicase n=1 Tax=Thamnocephalis sphaerospora TaxID=78915 RepID=A0A4P9XVS4_9FUNG|nr:P-loop containing nucleoside triphosphate hydrolase protein [Thamnocephalis sphaerospora]|eukprot:RKP10386.1 P-loop containing nucleoside triphosphate hydrolase protein [Thamnocephalis sphaerospora]